MADFDRVAEVYDATRSLRPDVMEAILDGLEHALRGTNSLLDVGVGTGRFADPLRRRGFEVVGVDLSRRMMAKAREKQLPNLILADAARLPLKSKSFEVAIVMHILHLVDDWSRVVRELGRVTSSYVVSVVQKVEGPRFRNFYIESMEELGKPMKKFKWGEEELARLCQPVKSRVLIRYGDETEADREIDGFQSRIYSETWNIPPTVHGKIIRRMREEYGGKKVRRKHEYRLVMWTPRELLNLRHPST